MRSRSASPFWRTTSASSQRDKRQQPPPAPEKERKVIGASYSHADILNLNNLYVRVVRRAKQSLTNEATCQVIHVHELLQRFHETRVHHLRAQHHLRLRHGDYTRAFYQARKMSSQINTRIKMTTTLASTRMKMSSDFPA
jgi:hypothetical protein